MICWQKTGSPGPRGQWTGVAQQMAGSAFTWSMLPVIAAKTERIGLAAGLTCPSVRYHLVVIAQAAATMALGRR
jgi:alkanesulfonate monooxygenase SsuD/methylene tetrahydromethanopterin reductase-like flavin-dependent oxidoreductase (luciferase family)